MSLLLPAHPRAHMRAIIHQSASNSLLSLILVGSLLVAPAALAADADGDGLDDAWEQGWFGSTAAYDGEDDPDRDALDNLGEQAAGSDPTHMDSDDDGLLDGEEDELGTDPLDPDSDGDGLDDRAEVVVHASDPNDPSDPPSEGLDSDGDGLSDASELELGTDPLDPDSDDDWLEDGQEEETDPTTADTDGDGLHDGWEVEVYASDPTVADSDGDGLDDASEHAWRYAGYLCLSLVEEDSDGDGLSDREEIEGGTGSDACEADSDGDGVLDAVEIDDGTDPADAGDHGTDSDGDGLSDSYEASLGSDSGAVDSDGDGLEDAQERFPLDDGLETDPTDVDSDDDGLLDGDEGGRLVAGEIEDGTDPSNADTDGDLLQDGLEQGLEEPMTTDEGLDGTDLAVFRPDLDPSTTTDPLDADSDGDGLSDGREDSNRNGTCEAVESCAEQYDTDGDGMHDGWEVTWGSSTSCTTGTPLDPTDPEDAAWDLDGDGLTALEEYQLAADFGGRSSPCDLDTDLDGLDDGLEVGASYGAGPSSPILADTDGDGLSDAEEDLDGDGRVGEGETDPSIADSDGDGLDDGEEQIWLGTDPLVADTDGDGLSDGEEELSLGTDPLDVDSDGDGLSDGLEAGRGDDADPASRTDPLAADSDGDGLEDGEEDLDGDGAQGEGETHPMDADTDDGGVSDGIEVLVNGTDPLDPSDDISQDSDGDGLDDELEADLGTDPYDPDTDGDGLWDGLEVGLVGDSDPNSTTDPLRADTDRDDLGDGLEDANGDGSVGRLEVDPNLSDSDGDGLWDGVEDADADGWMGASDGETDPRYADTDGDRLDDGYELNVGTNPLSEDTDGDTIRDNHEADGPSDLPPDTDRDGVIDALDPDSDGDTVADADEAGDDDVDTPPVDSDGDGAADFRDVDSDNGGVDDGTERRTHATDPTDPSDDGRGWLEDGGQIEGGARIGCSSAGHGGGSGWLLMLALPLLANRRRAKRARPGLGALLAAALLPTAAGAGVEHPDASNAAVDANPYRLDPTGLGILGTGSGRVLPGMELVGGVSLQQVQKPVVVASQADGELLRALVDERRQLDVSAAMGLGKGVELSLVLPVILHQDAELPGMKMGDVAARVVGDLRVQARLATLEGRRAALAGALPVVIPTGDSEAWMGTGLPAAEPTVQGSLDLGPVELAAGLGYRVQQRSSLYTMVDGHKLRASAAARFYQPQADWAVATEAWLATRAGGPFLVSGETAAEALLAGQWLPDWGLQLSAGVGAGLAAGVGAPSVRGLVSVGWGGTTRPDADKDGIPLKHDRCPDAQEDWDSFRDDDGCPDPDDDADGVADVDDACPLDAEDADGFEDDDGCPELDDDGDGVADGDDACPREAEDADGFEDADGCPELDDDGDGVADGDDACPREAEDLDEFEDEDGCPEEGPIVVEVAPVEEGPIAAVVERSPDPSPAEVLVEMRIHFAFGSTRPDAASEVALERVLALLSDHTDLRIVIEGHTDDVGSAETNQRVSQQRADGVKSWLVTHGGAELTDRLVARGYGESKPAVPNVSDANRAQNRRVVLRVD